MIFSMPNHATERFSVESEMPVQGWVGALLIFNANVADLSDKAPGIFGREAKRRALFHRTIPVDQPAASLP
jgi:hypothetical protein